MSAFPAPSAPSGHPLWSLPLTILVPLVGLPAFWIFSFLVYLIRCAIFGMDRTPRLDQLTRTPWLPRVVMEFGYWMFRIPVRLCIGLGISPNMITFMSFLMTLVTAVFSSPYSTWASYYPTFEQVRDSLSSH